MERSWQAFALNSIDFSVEPRPTWRQSSAVDLVDVPLSPCVSEQTQGTGDSTGSSSSISRSSFSSRSSKIHRKCIMLGLPHTNQQSRSQADAVVSLAASLADCKIEGAAVQPTQQHQQVHKQHGCTTASLYRTAKRSSHPHAGQPAASSAAKVAISRGSEEQINTEGLYSESAWRDFGDASPYIPVEYLGRGSIGRVYYCREKTTGEAFAIKVVAKHPLRGRRRLQRQVLTEKETLVALSVGGGLSLHPSVVSLYRTYQTPENLYFVLRYAGSVSLRDVLSRLRCAGLRLSPAAARLWAAEAAAALAALRSREVIHRDIRPENFIVSDRGHLTLVDFDAALRIPTEQQQQRDQQRQQQERIRSRRQNSDAASSVPTSSSRWGTEAVESAAGGVNQRRSDLLSRVLSPCAGTAAYAAPELFLPIDAQGEETASHSRGCGFGTDCWSFGCLLHELLLGVTPFRGESPAALATAVCGCQQLLLPQQLSASAADLLTRLLQPREADRLGARDIRELLQHPFFEGLDCMSLHHQPLPVDITQYAFAFGGSRGVGRSAAAAAAVAAAAARSASQNSDRDLVAGLEDSEVAAAAAAADAAAAITSAALDAELTPSVGCRFSPLKNAAGHGGLTTCLLCGNSRTCCCTAVEGADTVASAASASISEGSCGELRLSEGPVRPCRRLRIASSSNGADTAHQQHHQHEQQEENQRQKAQRQKAQRQQEESQQQHEQSPQHEDGEDQQSENQQQKQQQHENLPVQQTQENHVQQQECDATEEPPAACRCSVTEPVLGWGPPLQLQRISGLELSMMNDAAAAESAAAAAPADEGFSAGLSGASSSGSMRGVSMFRASTTGSRRYTAETPALPACAEQWLLKGETLRHHGMLFRMKEHRSLCERLFSRLFGGDRKRRNCQLQPQRCLALLTDAGRLLLLDPSGKTLKKTVHFATDGEIYTEGKDMLIYSSPAKGCYLLFASDGGTISAWARSFAVSIDGLREKAASVGPVPDRGCSQGTDVEKFHGRDLLPSEPPQSQTTFPLAACRTETSEFWRPPQFDWPAGECTAKGCVVEATEGSSIPTATGSTARPQAENSTTSGLLNDNANRTLIRLQEPPRYRRGSVRIPRTRAAHGHHLRQLHSEGPPGRPPGRPVCAGASPV